MLPPPLHLSGAHLEGGGQIPRIAAALAAITCQPLSLTSIRANRPSRRGRPAGGLKAQHAVAIAFLAQATGATVTGCTAGSTTLTFTPPSPPQPWRVASPVELALPTPGAVTLVLQTLLPFVARLPHPTRVVVRGGTHVCAAPSVSYFEHVALPVWRAMGVRARVVEVERCFSERGFRGALGRVVVDVEGLTEGATWTYQAFEGKTRGEVQRVGVVVLAPVGGFAEAVEALVRAAWPGVEVRVLEEAQTLSLGQWYCLVVLETSTGRRMGADWLPERGELPGEVKMNDLDRRGLERIAALAVGGMARELKTRWEARAGLDAFMEDQIVVYQALSRHGVSSGGKDGEWAGQDGDGTVNNTNSVSDTEVMTDEHGVAKTVPKERAPGTLHTLTARWVATEMLGVTFDQDGQCHSAGKQATTEA